MDKKYFVDICTLFEEHYTGIANVNYFVAKYFFEHLNDKTEFFHTENVVDKKYIEKLIKDKKGGEWIKELDRSGKLYKGKLKEYTKDIYSIGIFSHVKYVRNVFDYEAQIIHDITYILTKEFHHQDTTDYHLNFALKDFESNDLNICNSQATMEDIITYFQVDKNKTMVSLLGVDFETMNNPLYNEIVKKYNVEDYILILGTIEPRKNIDIVLKYLEKNPEILKKYKFVFLGKNGWGITFEDKFAQLNIDEDLKKNIIHLGFVSEDLKNILIKAAKFLIYPSIYEGFGLPVIESIAAGTPVLTTISSSIPEVGGDVSYYFHPYSLESFAKAFEKLDDDIRNNRISKEKLLNHAKKYRWDLFVNRFLKRIEEDKI
jgi:glycosyltransferase involved in cell wall biosynthesis